MVALKRLNREFGQGDPEFWKEIMMLSVYKHENIVSLLGYCDDYGEKILMYEYLPKKSLDRYLKSSELTWVRRLIKICIGAARGLAFLHNPAGTQQRVLHRDIKSSNILLDENWNAKISDFGLSKYGPANQKNTFLISHPVGTHGYCDPLYAETGFLTKESDVYSFGVVLCEVLCGRLCMVDDKFQPLVGLTRQSFRQNTVNQIVLTNIRDEINPNSLDVFSKVAYQCLKLERDERPLITEIVRGLEAALQCQRLSICIDAGRGLHYLHTGVEVGVIHRDITTTNILLDESWTAKIADFELVKIVPRNQTYVETDIIAGTPAYIDPNLFKTLMVTRKTDVYSFGMVLFEVLCRKRPVDLSLIECIKKGKLEQIPDSDIRDQIAPQSLKEFVRIAEACLQDLVEQRPTMAEVLGSLESVLTLQEKFDSLLQPTSKPAHG
ncbi:hypothetical protein CTI12_AA547430 [Artemisia annua]|uniref:Protein kinase domain-containing protein n=1 Tax=Artemisia annua TaxID=35608 RepID=A0A2U1KZH1_ARTAN|nr:hypothetical protein CTI12_AA547430 [Artemisia annua]